MYANQYIKMGNTKRKNQVIEPPKVAPEVVVKHKVHIREFKRQLRTRIITSRFSNETWAENAQFRAKNTQVGCVYCSPTMLSHDIAHESVVFVLEMNNDTNQIMGIGMVRNKPIVGKYALYRNTDYNMFVYIGKMRIAREDMTPEELEIMRFFDTTCFRGERHMKRGCGLTMYPVEILYKCSLVFDLTEFVRCMFKRRCV